MNVGKYVIIAQYGKGITYIYRTVEDRGAAFEIASYAARVKSKQYHAGNNPTFYVMERIGIAAAEPRKKMTEEQRKKRTKELRDRKKLLAKQIAEKTSGN